MARGEGGVEVGRPEGDAAEPEPDAYGGGRLRWFVTVYEIVAGRDLRPAARAALNAQLESRLGSAEAVTAMFAQMNGFVEHATNIFTHTHP